MPDISKRLEKAERYLQKGKPEAALEEYLAAHTALAIPTFAASGFCFLINLWLLKYLYDIDRNGEDS